VRGESYSCDWLEKDPFIGESFNVSSRTRALWVSEEGLLFQWILPDGVMQISHRDSFPPPADEARVAYLGARQVPNAAIREARLHMKRMQKDHAQEAVIQQALNRLIDSAKRREGRVQALLEKAGLRL